MDLKDIVEQLKMCGFQCEGGPLENHLAFKELERIASLAPKWTGSIVPREIVQALDNEGYAIVDKQSWLELANVDRRRRTDIALQLRQPTNAELGRERSANWFATQMNVKLQENTHKGGWLHCNQWWLLERLKDEVKELEEAMGQAAHGEIRIQEVIRECADVGNFAMMIADKANIEREIGNGGKVDASGSDREGSR